MLKLHEAVFYRKNDNQVILYHTKEHKIFTFNLIVWDILNTVGSGINKNDLIIELNNLYVMSEEDIEIVKKFIEVLISNKIVVETGMADYFGSLENKIVTSYKEGEVTNVLLELTYRCSEKCRHCYVVQGNAGELTTDEVKNILDQLADMNVVYLTLTGGEPYLRRDFIEILRYAYSRKFIIDIFTNGISISDDMFYETAACCPRYVHFSIYSSIPEVHDGITQVKGSFYKTVKAIKKFKALGVAVNIKTLVMKENCDDIENIIALAETLGATIQVGVSISATNDFEKKPLSFRVTDEEKLEKAIIQSRDKIETKGNRTVKRDINAPICGAGLNSFSINPKGVVYPCNALLIPIGNVRERSLSEIWNSSSELKRWREVKFCEIKGCDECDKKDFCGFCPGTAMSETGDPCLKYDEACRIAKIRRKIALNRLDTSL